MLCYILGELVQNLKSTDTGIQLKAIEDSNRFVITMKFKEFKMVHKSGILYLYAALKDKGNKAFAQEDYEMAVKYYSEGLAEIKGMQQLYTNRAQAYMKLGKYREVIADCEWALKCNEKCTKAYLHMGKAYLALKNYSEVSAKCFEKIVEIEPGRKNMIKDYLQQMDLDEKRDIQEKKAKQDFDMGEEKAIAVTQLLKKLSRPGYVPLFYCSALKCLTQAVTNSKCSS
uniref:Uncharacterized protein n=1 Tax=Neogobius melanostomus TaxID=47308 RepID=A0A8C6TAS1_9GOBI